MSAEAPVSPQFLKFPSQGNVNAMVNGEVADPLLLDLARLAEEDEYYSLMVQPVCLGDTLKDLPHNHLLR